MLDAPVPIALSRPFTVSWQPGLNFTITPGWMLSVAAASIEIEFFTQKTVPTTEPVGPQLVFAETLDVIWTTWAEAAEAARKPPSTRVARATERRIGDLGQRRDR